MHKKVKFLISMGLVAALCGCASHDRIGSVQGSQYVPNGVLPAPVKQDYAALGNVYLLSPLDKLNVSVLGVEELSNKDVQVDASGHISFPLAGDVEVGGHSAAEASALIAQKLKSNYVRDPQVSVLLTESNGSQITVEGEVNKPGLYPALGRMTLLQAVASAQGTTAYAKLESIVVLRVVNNKHYIALYNMKSIARGLYNDPEVYAHDVVIVGDSPQRRLFNSLIASAGSLATPLVLLTQKF
jgi:polysaccharide biosynthesis/export protein